MILLLLEKIYKYMHALVQRNIQNDNPQTVHSNFLWMVRYRRALFFILLVSFRCFSGTSARKLCPNCFKEKVEFIGL